MKELKTSNGFVFQAIPLEEAVTIVRAGSGIYAEIKEVLLKTLPQLEEDTDNPQAFAFGLPNGKDLADKDRKGIGMALANTLKKAGLHWKIVYSDRRRQFICAPMESRPRSYAKNGNKPSVKPRGGMEEIIDKAAEVFGMPREILIKKNVQKPYVTYRKAIISVATDKGIPPKLIGDALSVTNDAVYFSMKKGSTNPAKEINLLKEALS